MKATRTARPAAQDSAAGQHSDELRRVYERVLAGATVRSRFVDMGGGRRVHLLEKGEDATGRPVLLLHGGGNSAGFLLPLLNTLTGPHVIAVDLPGIGLSDPIDMRPESYRETAVEWLDELLAGLKVDRVALVGHSGGGMWALWYALARPRRVDRLVLIAPPSLPGTRCYLPLRVIATPMLGDLVARLAPPTPTSMLRLGRVVGEGSTLPRHPDLIDLMVALGRDPVTEGAAKTEFRALLSPFGLITRSGFRRRLRARPDELRSLAMPTLLIWGERDRLGSPSAAKAVVDLIPDGHLTMLPTGHGPWLGEPERTAKAIQDFVR